jgi:biuret amidohydrolase
VTALESNIGFRLNSLLTLDPATTVVVTVDMQREYLDPTVGTSLIPTDDLTKVVSSTVAMLAEARDRSIPVVHAYVNRRRQEVARGFQKSPYAEAGKRHGILQNPRATHLGTPDRLEGSPIAELLGVLDGPDDVHITTKKTMDCFYGTDLDLLLRRAFRAEAVLLAGINTDSCVYSTAFSASNHGYRCVVVSDCTASMRGPATHLSALGLMAGAFAWVMDTGTVFKVLDSARRVASR